MLQVGKTRHNGPKILFCQRNQDLLNLEEERPALVEQVAQVKPHVEADLIVATSCRVQFAADFTDLLDQSLLDGHVDIFLGGGQVHLPPFDLTLNLSQARNNQGGILIRDDFGCGEHAAVSDTAFDIVTIEPPVKMNRCGEFFHLLVHLLFKAALPGLFPHIDPCSSVTEFSFTGEWPFISRKWPFSKVLQQYRKGPLQAVSSLNTSSRIPINRSISDSSTTRGGTKRSTVSWVQLMTAPFSRHRSTNLAPGTSSSRPTISPRPRTSLTKGCRRRRLSRPARK